MKILVLKANKQVYDVDLIDNFNKYGVANSNMYEIGYLDDLIFDYTENIAISIYGKDVLDFDLIYFRTWEKRPDIAVTLAKHLVKNNKKFIDTAAGVATYGSKVLQHYTLMVNDLPLPKTYAIHKRLLDQELDKHIKLLGGYPAVLKSTKGSEGRGVYLLHSFEDFKKIENELKEAYYFVQEYIENDSDYRFVVFGTEVKVIKKRVRSKDSAEFRNNVSLGAAVEYINPSELPELCELALKAARVKNLQVAGVDIVVSSNDNKVYLFEANPAPAFKNDFTVLKYLDDYIKSILQ